MINLVIAGSIGLDDIETPHGRISSGLGGSATYASTAASFFVKPGVISIMGQDMPKEHLKFLQKKFDTDGIIQKDKTFRWSGFYEFDMNEAKTRSTELNSLLEFKANIPESYKDAKFLLLGNFDPNYQMDILKQMKNHPFVMLDSMNFYISSKKAELLKAIEKVNFLVLNEGEARQLCETPNLIVAGKKLLNLGPQYVAIKKGEHGALLFSQDSIFSAASFPLETVKDPTGCGDSFAGGLMGYLAKTNDTSEANIRKGIIYGTAIASFCAQNFGLEYTKNTKLNDIKDRYQALKTMGKF